MKEVIQILENHNLSIRDPRVENLKNIVERYKNSVSLPGPWHIEQHLDTGLLFITHEEERQSDDYSRYNLDYIIVSSFDTYPKAAKEYNKRVSEIFAVSIPKSKKSWFSRLLHFIKSIPFPKTNLDRI